MTDNQAQLVRMLAEHDQLRAEFRDCADLLAELAGADGLVSLLARYVLIDMELATEVVLETPNQAETGE